LERELNKGDERNTIGNGMKMRTLRGNGGEENEECLEKEIETSPEMRKFGGKREKEKEQGEEKKKEERYK
jgi:hypothetical protein